MAKNSHGRLLAAAAKPILQPLGFQRRGQSRLWLADERFWLIVVEFQPSSWSKGSYLNVGAQWLWYPKEHFSFDSGYRVETLAIFKSEAQFALEAERLARRASEEALKLRENFSSLSVIASRLEAEAAVQKYWPLYHGAVAAGLAQRIDAARTLFERLLSETGEFDWQKQLYSTARKLAASLDDPAAFRSQVSHLIEECRALQKLPFVPDCLP